MTTSSGQVTLRVTQQSKSLLAQLAARDGITHASMFEQLVLKEALARGLVTDDDPDIALFLLEQDAREFLDSVRGQS